MSIRLMHVYVISQNITANSCNITKQMKTRFASISTITLSQPLNLENLNDN